MIGRKDVIQNNFEFVVLNDFGPSNHNLRFVSEKIDFTFIFEKVEKYIQILVARLIDPVQNLTKQLKKQNGNRVKAPFPFCQQPRNGCFNWFMPVDLNVVELSLAAASATEKPTRIYNYTYIKRTSAGISSCICSSASDCCRTGTKERTRFW